jgi:hypothetical protein
MVFDNFDPKLTVFARGRGRLRGGAQLEAGKLSAWFDTDGSDGHFWCEIKAAPTDPLGLGLPRGQQATADDDGDAA